MLSSRRRIVVPATCVALALSVLGLFAAGLPARFEEIRSLSIFHGAQREEVIANLARLGLSADLYAGYYLALGAAFAIACFALATLIFVRKPYEPIALFVALALVLHGATFSGALEGVGAVHQVLKNVADLLDALSLASLFLFFYLFPDGRFVPRWTRWPAFLLVAWAMSTTLLPGSPLNPNNWPDALFAPVMLGWLFTGVFAQVYRYRYTSSRPERQQTKWVVFGFAAALSGFFALTSIDLFFPSLQPGTLADFVITAALHCFMLVIPLSLAIANLRYRLWDIDVIINRTLVYGALSASVVGLYALLVGGLGSLLPLSGNFVASLVVAVLFAPLRIRLQRGVNRLMYGERDEPYAVLSRLGRRLEGTLAPEAALETVAESVAQALKLPYAAIELRRDNGYRRVAEHGDPKDENEALPLLHQGEIVGRLVMAPRSRG